MAKLAELEESEPNNELFQQTKVRIADARSRLKPFENKKAKITIPSFENTFSDLFNPNFSDDLEQSNIAYSSFEFECTTEFRSGEQIFDWNFAEPNAQNIYKQCWNINKIGKGSFEITPDQSNNSLDPKIKGFRVNLIYNKGDSQYDIKVIPKLKYEFRKELNPNNAQENEQILDYVQPEDSEGFINPKYFEYLSSVITTGTHNEFSQVQRENDKTPLQLIELTKLPSEDGRRDNRFELIVESNHLIIENLTYGFDPSQKNNPATKFIKGSDDNPNNYKVYRIVSCKDSDGEGVSYDVINTSSSVGLDGNIENLSTLAKEGSIINDGSIIKFQTGEVVAFGNQIDKSPSLVILESAVACFEELDMPISEDQKRKLLPALTDSINTSAKAISITLSGSIDLKGSKLLAQGLLSQIGSKIAIDCSNISNSPNSSDVDNPFQNVTYQGDGASVECGLVNQDRLFQLVNDTIHAGINNIKGTPAEVRIAFCGGDINSFFLQLTNKTIEESNLTQEQLVTLQRFYDNAVRMMADTIQSVGNEFLNDSREQAELFGKQYQLITEEIMDELNLERSEISNMLQNKQTTERKTSPVPLEKIFAIEKAMTNLHKYNQIIEQYRHSQIIIPKNIIESIISTNPVLNMQDIAKTLNLASYQGTGVYGTNKSLPIIPNNMYDQDGFVEEISRTNLFDTVVFSYQQWNQFCDIINQQQTTYQQ